MLDSGTLSSNDARGYKGGRSGAFYSYTSFYSYTGVRFVYIIPLEK